MMMPTTVQGLAIELGGNGLVIEDDLQTHETYLSMAMHLPAEVSPLVIEVKPSCAAGSCRLMFVWLFLL